MRCVRNNIFFYHHAGVTMASKNEKWCNKCRASKPLEEFSKCSRNKSGLQSRCKRCEKELYDRKNAMTVCRQVPREKKCGTCGCERSSDEFPKRVASVDGLAATCKSCAKAYRQKWVKDNANYEKDRYAKKREHMLKKSADYKAENPERVKESNRQWRINNPERAALAGRRWAERNKERVAMAKRRWEEENKDLLRSRRAQNREHRLAYWAGYSSKNANRIAAKNALWKKQNPDKVSHYTALRRAARKQAIPTWADMDKISEFYKMRDLVSETTGEPYHVDHIVPLQSTYVCGLHNEFNLRVIPGKDNCIKNNKFWDDMPDYLDASISYKS